METGKDNPLLTLEPLELSAHRAAPSARTRSSLQSCCGILLPMHAQKPQPLLFHLAWDKWPAHLFSSVQIQKYLNKISFSACSSICQSSHACATGSPRLGCLKAAFSASRNVNSVLLNMPERFLRSLFTYVLYYLCFCFSWFVLLSHNLLLAPPLTRLMESWHVLIYCFKSSCRRMAVPLFG